MTGYIWAWKSMITLLTNVIAFDFLFVGLLHRHSLALLTWMGALTTYLQPLPPSLSTRYLLVDKSARVSYRLIDSCLPAYLPTYLKESNCSHFYTVPWLAPHSDPKVSETSFPSFPCPCREELKQCATPLVRARNRLIWYLVRCPDAGRLDLRQVSSKTVVCGALKEFERAVGRSVIAGVELISGGRGTAACAAWRISWASIWGNSCEVSSGRGICCFENVLFEETRSPDILECFLAFSSQRKS